MGHTPILIQGGEREPQSYLNFDLDPVEIQFLGYQRKLNKETSMSTGKSEGVMLASKLTLMLSPCTSVLVSSPAAVIKMPWQGNLRSFWFTVQGCTHSIMERKAWQQELEEAGNIASTGSDTGWAQQHSAEDRGR